MLAWWYKSSLGSISLLSYPGESAQDGNYNEHVRNDAADNDGRVLYGTVLDDVDNLIDEPTVLTISHTPYSKIQYEPTQHQIERIQSECLPHAGV